MLHILVKHVQEHVTHLNLHGPALRLVSKVIRLKEYTFLIHLAVVSLAEQEVPVY